MRPVTPCCPARADPYAHSSNRKTGIASPVVTQPLAPVAFFKHWDVCVRKSVDSRPRAPASTVHVCVAVNWFAASVLLC